MAITLIAAFVGCEQSWLKDIVEAEFAAFESMDATKTAKKKIVAKTLQFDKDAEECNQCGIYIKGLDYKYRDNVILYYDAFDNLLEFEHDNSNCWNITHVKTIYYNSEKNKKLCEYEHRWETWDTDIKESLVKTLYIYSKIIQRIKSQKNKIQFRYR
jgi:hypothetical protein